KWIIYTVLTLFTVILFTGYYMNFSLNNLKEKTYTKNNVNQDSYNYISDKYWFNNYLSTSNNKFDGLGVKVAVLDTIQSKNKCSSHYNNKNIQVEKTFHADEVISTILSISPNISLYCASVASASGMVDIDELSMGIKWAIEKKVDIINMSLGFERSNKEIDSLIQLANKKGILMIAASGNQGKSILEYPASSQFVIGVGAVDSNGKKWVYSNYGDDLDFVLPGVFYESEKNFKQGTSYAAAAMTGIVSRLLEEFHYITPSMVYAKLIEMTNNENGFNKFMGHGIPTFRKSLGE
ncbi:S8 family serine peptidase, partial [Gottfriedia acidiceleris]|uniref:S8 family peptidase n=2 Tax=Bacillaceae TaxID=186817 RepID=UPI003395071F